MILKKIREGKFSKVIASYLSIQLLLQVAGGSNIYALTSGPSQPEFNSFTPIGTSDMVDLSSGDFSYNIPVIDVGGYPLNLSYKSGITMDQEASWVGLGWNLNIGQINRQMRGLPDDFDGTKGDEMLYENNMRDNITVGAAVNLNPQLLGYEPPETPPPAPDPDASPVPQFNVGLGIKYNNYTGVSWEPTAGFTFELTKGVSVGMDVSTTASGGVNLAPNTNFSKRIGESKLEHINGIFGGLGIGTSFNSRQGITGISMSAGVSASYKEAVKMELSDYKMNMTSANNSASLGGASSSISFINNTFTPMKRTAINNNSFTMSFSTGLSAWGLDGEGGVTAYGTIQSVKDKQISVPAFGYENDHKGDKDAVLDFNRENDRIVSKNTTVLPTTNNTYDIYSINGQGISGMFRPHRSQTGYIYDRFVEDGSTSFQLGLEAEIGSGAHFGFDARYTDVESSTGLWNTPAANSFKEKDLTEYDYRKSYFKRLGDLSVDKESDLLNEDLHGNKAMAVKVSGVAYGNDFNRSLESAYVVKNSETDYANKLFESEFRRTKRETPNETIEKIINDEAGEALDPFIKKEELLKGHHTVGMRLLQPDGSTYVYGEAAVNTKKEEVTFATEEGKDCLTGLIETVDGTENKIYNESGQDQMFNRVSTPAYAHTYLLTSILSSDYEDVNGNGPDHRDLGSYTKFSYDKTVDDYKWRLPYYGAIHDEGFKTIKDDQKASYVYGEKELKYVTKIETKTHVARIEFEERRDGTEAYHENASLSNGQGTQNMKKIKRIYLFSKPEYDQLIAEGISFDGTIDETSNEYKQITKAAIKVAHFEYDYSLCKDVYNNNNQSYLDPDGNEANQGGKLTLKKVFFTYRGSEMGRYTPYKFNYDGFNPNYNFKSYDVWGNYKPIVSDIVSTNSDGTVEYDDNVPVSCGVTSSVTAPEYPYVQQEDKNLQDAYASAWSLTSIDLPSGGKMNVEYETDDYQYVQDKKAMQMFKVVGSSNSPTSLGDNRLYNGITGDDNYLVVEIPEAIGSNYSYAEFLEEYIGDQLDKPIFFRFLLNMHRRPANGNFSRDEMDYVEGYFKLEQGGDIIEDANTGKVYASIKMRTTGIHNSDDDGINPISKAGWHFGRKYMNQTVYTGNTTPSSTNPLTIAKDLFQAIGEIR
ncbi:MAG: hypothetical protein HRT68_03610, partial [Flavobacteriaceae bacterium]|nr:hypothetical protein [Flavobacteriaceae bacterium]